MNNPPRVLAWLEIPEDCHMSAELDYDGDLRFTLGQVDQDTQHVVFERVALERFVQLANEALKIEQPKDPKADAPPLVSAA